MSDRPKVTVEHTSGPSGMPVGFSARMDTDLPSVSIRVDFALHDHDRALTALADAVDHVRSQIQEDPRP